MDCPHCGNPIDLPERESDTEAELSVDTDSRLLAEGQDPNVVDRTLARVRQILTAGEDLEYVAIQQKPVVNFTPLAVVLTSRRFILYKPGLLGSADFEDYIWRDLRDAHVKEKMVGATLTIETVDGHTIQVDYLPKDQARRAYAIAQHMEERVAEMRRQRELEDKRAAAGGVVVQAAQGKKEPEDPVAKLEQLKRMLDASLISQAEYDDKKTEILSRF